jgi:ADP-ribose pyrophosphatase
MIKKWKQIKEVPYKTDYRKMSRVTFKLSNGQLADFDIIKGNKLVSVFAVTQDDKILLIRQFRPGPQKVVFDLAGGGVNLSESPKAAAKRELLEETGHAGQLYFLGTTVNGPYDSAIRYNFIAQKCKKISNPAPDEHEFIEPVLVSFRRFRELLKSRALIDVATGYLALDYLKLL